MSTVREVAVAQFVGIVGASNVVDDPAEVAAYAIDGKTPAAVVRPGSSEEVVAAVKLAASEKLAIIPTGARTKLAMGLPPAQYDLALDMSRLDKVLAYDPGDLTLGVEPGMPLSKLAAILAEHGQFLPLAAPYAERSTVGGTIASGVDGPLRQLYGTARDFVLGIEFVTGEGIPAKGGGRVVKNVAGYDLHKLMIGAMGTLGVITRINFRTFPLPASSLAFVVSFETAERALDLRRRVAQSPLRPMALEILSPGAAELFSSDAAKRIANGTIPANLFPASHWAFTADFAGDERVLERCERELRERAGESGTASFAVLDDAQRIGVFDRKREFIPMALDSSPGTVIMKVSLLPSQMQYFCAQAAKIANANALPWAAMARGLGIIYVALLPERRDEDWRNRIVLAAEQISAATVNLGGNASIPWCPSEWNSSLKNRTLRREDFAQMKKLKGVFDPQGILAPGRLLGGL
jgi:glycolate oxidase FAD binding subunit